MNTGVNPQKLCDWLKTSSLNVTCSYQTGVTLNSLKSEIKKGPIVLFLEPFYNASGVRLQNNVNHYITLSGYDAETGYFIVLDSLGNANSGNTGWGYGVGNYANMKFSYDINAMVGYSSNKSYLVIRGK